jgi:hypothetical protein
VAGDSTANWGSPVRPYSSSDDVFVAQVGDNGTLIWNTFLGGSGNDDGNALAVDNITGNVYVAGSGPASWGSPVRPYAAGNDAFAAMLGDNGSLVWNTFLGGSDDDQGFGIAVNSNGDACVAGQSGATWGSPTRPYSSGYDGFVARLSDNGSMTWNTFLGGGGNDFSRAIAMDREGGTCVAGYSYATWGAPQRLYSSLRDAFAAGISDNGSLTWNTFLGGIGDDEAKAIAVDNITGNVYLTGFSTDTWGSPRRDYSSGLDAFVARISPSPTPTASVTNGSGATSIMATTAILHGNLTSTGSEETTVTIYGGPSDGLENPDNWESHTHLGIRSAGPFSLGVTGLPPDATYYYRCAATNASGTAWAPSSYQFATQPYLGLWRNYWAGPGKDYGWFSSGPPTTSPLTTEPGSWKDYWEGPGKDWHWFSSGGP